jgi:hypothetical protein
MKPANERVFFVFALDLRLTQIILLRIMQTGNAQYAISNPDKSAL